MDETMLKALQREPAPGFARHLWTRLQEADEQRASRAWPVRRLAAAVAVAAGVGLLLSVPAVRAQAASFLSLFRVVTFVPVSVDPARLEAVGPLSIRTLLGDRVQVLQEPGPATPVVSLDQAASLAGYPLRLPQSLPEGSRVIEIEVAGEGLVRVTADTARLDSLLDSLGITDLRAPAELDGQVATIRVPRGVMIRYEQDRWRTRFFQAPAPQVTIPSGVPLQALGEIGLRILGVPADDARRFAAATDWRSTLLVPISPKVTSVRQVAIGAGSGLAMEFSDPPRTSMVIWSSGDRVFAIVSIAGLPQVLEMANSVR